MSHIWQVLLWSLVTTFFLGLQQSSDFFIIFLFGIASLLIAWFVLYDRHFQKHFHDEHRFFHWTQWKHLFSHSLHGIIPCILYISTSVLLSILHLGWLEYIVMGIFFLLLSVYYMSVVHRLRNLFLYEEKHLHLSTLVKLYTCASSLLSLTYLVTRNILSPIEGSIFTVCVVLLLLWVFCVKHGKHQVPYIPWIFINIGMITLVLFQWLFTHIHSPAFLFGVLLGWYYFAWSILRQYVLHKISLRLILEYSLIVILIITLVTFQAFFWERIV